MGAVFLPIDNPLLLGMQTNSPLVPITIWLDTSIVAFEPIAVELFIIDELLVTFERDPRNVLFDPETSVSPALFPIAVLKLPVT